MKIHNILEEQVLNRVATIFNDKDIQDAPWFHCGCEQCKLDTVAYVLNRLKPRYVVSERGIAHAVSEEGYQLDADVDFLIIEGMKKVATVRRDFHGKEDLYASEINEFESAFNFPIFIGNILDGNTFQPIQDGTITLKLDNVKVELIDETWSNPYYVRSMSKGSYTFWLKPITSEHYDEEKTFNFLMEIDAENYESTRYSFPLTVTSTNQHDTTPDATNRYKIDNLYLFPVDVE